MNRRMVEFLVGAVGVVMCGIATTQLPLKDRPAPTLVGLVLAAFVGWRFWTDVLKQ